MITNKKRGSTIAANALFSEGLYLICWLSLKCRELSAANTGARRHDLRDPRGKSKVFALLPIYDFLSSIQCPL